MQHRNSKIWLLVGSLLISGCAKIANWYGNNLNINGALPPFENDERVNRVDLIATLVPSESIPRFNDQYRGCLIHSSNGGIGLNTNPDLTDDQARGCLEAAFKEFQKLSINVESRRNNVAGRLRAASELNCTQFNEHLNAIQAHGNLFTGILATALAGAGAITTPANTARALSGAAGIMSGTRAEFNADIFFREAAPVIVNAIKLERSKMRQELDNKMKLSIADYPVELAVADVFRYNDACSLVGGLAAANQSITLVENPGLDSLNKSLLKANLTRFLMEHPTYTDSNILKDDGTGNYAIIAGLPASSPRKAPTADPLIDYQSAVDSLLLTAGDVSYALTADSLLKDTAVKLAIGPTVDAISKIVTSVAAAGTNGLRSICETKAINSHTDILKAKLAVQAAQTDSERQVKQLDLRYKESFGALLIAGIEKYKETIIRGLVDAKDRYLQATNSYKSGASKGDLTALTKIVDNTLVPPATEPGVKQNIDGLYNKLTAVPADLALTCP